MSVLNIVLDLILLGLFVFSLIYCVRQGMVKSLFKSLRIPVSFIMAFLLNRPIGGLIQAKWMNGVIYDWIYGMVSPVVEENQAAASGLADSIPNSIKSILAFFGHSTEKAAGEALSAEDIASAFSLKISEPLAGVVSSLIAFAIVFFITWLLMILLGFLLDKLFKLPVLRTVNRVGGIIVGVFSGFCCVWGAAQLIVLLCTWFSFIPFVGEQFSIENSILLKFFYGINPLRLLLMFAG